MFKAHYLFLKAKLFLDKHIFVPDHYRVLGRVIHMSYIREQLRTQRRLNFDAARQNVRHAPQLEILTDTLYIQV